MKSAGADELEITAERVLYPQGEFCGKILPGTEGPHCLVAQDVALSRPKHRFESGWGHFLNSV